MKKYLILFFLQIFVVNNWAQEDTLNYSRRQQDNKKNIILSNSNISRLKELANKFRLEYDKEFEKSRILSDKLKIKQGQNTEFDKTFHFKRIENNVPLFYGTQNEKSAQYTKTDLLWSGKAQDIGCSGMRILMWDGGKAHPEQLELKGNVFNTSKTYQYTSSGTQPKVISHATNVAGTLVAKGINPSVHGMDPKSNVEVNWYLDDLPLMALEASNPLHQLQLSNHSYNTLCGWTRVGTDANIPIVDWYGDLFVSDKEDYKFGFYTYESQGIDEITNAAPYYTVVFSAGNNRNKDFEDFAGGTWSWAIFSKQQDDIAFIEKLYDGSTSPRRNGDEFGYDCIAPPATAKNIITVGAIDASQSQSYTGASSVLAATFSGWGPTDDGRIKPDIVAPGVRVLTTTYNDLDLGATEYKNGTSFSAPIVTGSIALLMQYYEKTHNGSPARSSTMKALIIHSADEAGLSNGPDYQFGWGLINTSRAASIITNDSELSTPSDKIYIKEAELSALTREKVFYVKVEDTSTPLRATIAWTDKPGVVETPSLNPTTKRLINDIDLRITKVNTLTEILPWVLDPANRSAAATQGDNVRDNVEQIVVTNPAIAYYKISIRSKNTLTESQWVSLIVTGAVDVDNQPILTVDKSNIEFSSYLDLETIDISNSGVNDLTWSASVEVSAQSWLHIVNSPTSGTNTGQLQISCDENQLTSNRSGKIIIAGNGINCPYEILVTQRGRNTANYYFEQVSSFSGLINSKIDCADYDKDGDADFAIIGEENVNGHLFQHLRLYRNDNGSFSQLAPFPNLEIEKPFNYTAAMSHGNVKWGDYDNDGHPDLFVTAYSSVGDFTTKLFKNVNGNFDEVSTLLPAVVQGSIDLGDYDNDGDLDVLICGVNLNLTRITKLFKNDSGTFNEQATNFVGIANGVCKWGDMNDDGNLDVLLVGAYNSGAQILPTTKIYLQTNGSFEPLTNSIDGLQESDAIIADFNYDGTNDIITMGRLNGNGCNINSYKNIANNGIPNITEYQMLSMSYNIMKNGDLQLVDYDNDGFLELSVTGRNYKNVPQTKIYEINSSFVFSEVEAKYVENIPKVAFGSSAWLDYDNDGDVDLVISGQDANQNSVLKIYRNNINPAPLKWLEITPPIVEETNSQAYYVLNHKNVKSGTVLEQRFVNIEAIHPQSQKFKFLMWSDGVTTNKRSFNAQGNTNLYAIFKVDHSTNISAALTSNNQRKVVKTPDGAIHMVYESMGRIWYETSTDGGTTWVLAYNGSQLINGDIAFQPQILSCANFYIAIAFKESTGFPNSNTIRVRLYKRILDTPNSFSYCGQIWLDDTVVNNYGDYACVSVGNNILFCSELDDGLYYTSVNIDTYTHTLIKSPSGFAKLGFTDLNSKNPSFSFASGSSVNKLYLFWQQDGGINSIGFDPQSLLPLGSSSTAISVGEYTVNTNPLGVSYEMNVSNNTPTVSWIGRKADGTSNLLVRSLNTDGATWSNVKNYGNNVTSFDAVSISSGSDESVFSWKESNGDVKYAIRSGNTFSSPRKLNGITGSVHLMQGATATNEALAYYVDGSTTPYEIKSTQLVSTMPTYSLQSGWNWFSLNCTPPNFAINSLFNQSTFTEDDIIKGQTSYAQFLTGGGWVGSLSGLTTNEMYKIKLSNAINLTVDGDYVDLAVNQIYLKTGYNWIAYSPSSVNSISNALAPAFLPVTGDKIKSKSLIAEYNGTNWIGSLSLLNPGEGYLYHSLSDKILQWNNSASPKVVNVPETAKTNKIAVPGWEVNPNKFENNMSVIAELKNVSSFTEDDVLAAFIGNDCRGSATPVLYNDKQLYFLVIHGDNSEIENVKLKFFSGKMKKKVSVIEEFNYAVNKDLGSLVNPVKLTLAERSLEIPTEFNLSQNYPNPFNPSTTIEFGLPESKMVRVEVFNSIGQRVKTLLANTLNAGYHSVTWDGTDDFGSTVSSGLYLYRINAGNFSRTRKMMFLK